MMLPFKELILKHNLNITGVLHCGANVCQEAELYSETINGEVVWVEALPDIYEQAGKVLIDYPNQTIIEACLGSEDGKEVTFHISSNGSQSSSYLDFGEHLKIHPDVSFVGDITLTTKRLDTLFSYGLGSINFLMLDLQGAELEALKGMGKLIHKIDYILTECNAKETYIGCPLIEELDIYLYEFTRVETGDFVGGCWSDCLYVRTSLL